MDENVQKVASKLFTVASRRDSNIVYCVDTLIGRCECPQGMNGSTCWHQFLLWSKFKESSFNFLPVFDPEAKKELTEIAIGSSLETHFYDSIHCFTMGTISAPPNRSEDLIEEREIECKKSTEKSFPEISIPDPTTPDIIKMFDEFHHNVKEELLGGNQELRKSMEKFLGRYEKFSTNQRNSALQSFGTVFVGKSKGRIKVQPTAVSRRVSQIGSRQRQSNKRTKPLPERRITLKRKRKLAECVNLNVPSAKKAGTTMKSNTKYPKKKTLKKPTKVE